MKLVGEKEFWREPMFYRIKAHEVNEVNSIYLISK